MHLAVKTSRDLTINDEIETLEEKTKEIHDMRRTKNHEQRLK